MSLAGLALASVWLFAGAAAARPDPRAIDGAADAPDARAAALVVLGPGAPLADLQVRESLTGTHVRFHVLASDGTPVFGEDVAVHLVGRAPRFRARLLDAPGRGVWSVVGARRIRAAEALARAAAAAGGAARRAEAVARPIGPYLARPAWRVLVDIDRPPQLREVWVDAGDGAVEVGPDLLMRATGSGMVYRPNPVTESGDRTLLDNDDADSDELTALREQVDLEGLDGTGVLRGEWADVHNPATRAMSPTLQFNYTRSQPEFEEVNAYYAIDRAQREVQALGFTGDKAVQALPFEVIVNALPDDDSFFDADANRIRAGSGGVDDAEDADVLRHEYGHAIENAVVPGFGRSADALALGEGWGDIQAYALPTLASKPPLVERECLAPWDASAYDPPADCLRRVDGQKHLPEGLMLPRREPHYDGEIWSGALYEMFIETGLGPVDGYKLVLESIFDYSASESFKAASEALLAADQRLYGGVHADVIRRVLIWRGLLATISPPVAWGGEVTAIGVALDSDHPVANSADVAHTFHEDGARALRVHFASMDMETGTTCRDSFCDAIYLYDGDGNLYARLGGTASDYTSVGVPGDTLVVRWVSDSANQSTGFTIDRLEALVGPAPEVDAGPAPEVDAGPSPEEPPDAAPGPMDRGDPQGGCGCQASGGPGGGAAALALLIAAAAAARRRRRRARS